MPLKAFNPHRKEFNCNYEKIAELPLDQEAEALFREGLSVTSFDLWPNERNFGKAAKLWTKAAEKRHWQAMLNLASLYIEGKGVEPDRERGIQLVEELMVMGLPRAYDFMGTLHMNGTGVNQDATRAYAFWSLAAEMGSSDAQAYLGDRLNAVYDDPARAIWGNREIAYKLLRCGYSQENGKAAATLGLSIDIAGDHIQALQILHDGVKFGSEMSAIFLAVDFDTGGTETKYLKDKDRGERYGAIADLLHLNPDLRLPNLDKVLPLPPAILPYWDGEKESLIDGAKPVKTISLDDIKPSPASLREGRAHIPDGFVLPDEPQGGHLVQHLHTDAVIGGYWLAQLRKPVTPRQVAWNAAQVPMRYEIGEAFDKTPEGLTKDDGVFRFHYLGTPVPQAPEAKYAPDWRVPQGVMREVPMPARELHSTGLLPAPATGIWHGSVDPGHPLAKVFNQWYRQSYVEEGQAFPDPRDRGLDISPKDIQWRWLDQANRPQPSGRKEITIRNFSYLEAIKKGP
ncbi:sel1 repeat family protein [Herbaspirillum frisingense]|nr:sel1 repeat family protein [Herbaspirillum frisingense]